MRVTGERELVRDKQDALGLHKTEWTRRGPGLRGRVDPLFHDFHVAIAGVEGGSDQEGDQRRDREHHKESEEPARVRCGPRSRVLRHL